MFLKRSTSFRVPAYWNAHRAHAARKWHIPATSPLAVHARAGQVIKPNPHACIYVPLISDGWSGFRRAQSLEATSFCPGCGLLSWISESKASGVPFKASMDSAAITSACLVMSSARCNASAPRALINWVPLMMESPCNQEREEENGN